MSLSPTLSVSSPASSVASAAADASPPSGPPVTIPTSMPPLPPLDSSTTNGDIFTMSAFAAPPAVDSAESIYLTSGNNKGVLFAMAMGAEDSEGDTLADLETDEIFINYKGKKRREFTPSRAVMANERKRRKEASGHTGKVGMSTPRNLLKIWLDANPIENERDLTFIRGEVMKFKTTLNDFNTRKVQLGSPGEKGNWRGDAPWLRLIHATLEDDQSRLLYQKSFEIPTREQMDGRHNSQTKKANVWERVSLLWNNSDFQPQSSMFGDLHVTFSDPIDISFEAVAEMGVLSPKKARDKFTSLVSKLNTVKAKWEASGQGTGGRLEGESDESENGTNVVDDDEFGGAQAKSDFLNGYLEVVLYLWEFSANLNVLTSVLQRISGSCALDGSSCGPNSSKTKADKKRKLEDDEKDGKQKEMKLLQEMGSTMKETNEALFMFNVEEMKKRILELKEKIFDAEDKRDDLVDAGVHEDRLARQNKRIDTLNAVLDGQQHALAKYHVSKNPAVDGDSCASSED